MPDLFRIKEFDLGQEGTQKVSKIPPLSTAHTAQAF